MSSSYFSVDTSKLQGRNAGRPVPRQPRAMRESSSGWNAGGRYATSVDSGNQLVNSTGTAWRNPPHFPVDTPNFQGRNAGRTVSRQPRPMRESPSAGTSGCNTGGRYVTSVDSGNQPVKNTGTVGGNPPQFKQASAAPSPAVETSAQPSSQNIENNNLMAYFASLPHKQQAKVQSFLKLMTTETSVRPGTEEHPEMNGVSTVMQAKEQVPTVHQSNVCHEAKPTANPTTTQTVVQSNPLITSQPNRDSNSHSNAAQGQMEIHIEQLSRRNPFFDNPNYRWKGPEDTPALMEHVEKLLGAKIPAEAYKVVTRGFIWRDKLEKRLGWKLDSQNPGGNQPQPAQGNSTDGESSMPVSTSPKRKQDGDDATPSKRLRLSPHADDAGSRYATSVDSGNQLVKSTGTVGGNPPQPEQALAAPSPVVEASAQPPSQNIENDNVSYMAYFASPAHKARGKRSFMKLFPIETSVRPGTEEHPEMNGVSTVMQAKDQVPPTVHQSNVCHEAPTNPTTTQTVAQSNPPITSQPNPDSNSHSNAAQGQMEIHIEQTLSRRNPFDNPNYRWKGPEDTPALIEFRENALGIKIPPEDHEIFIQDFIFCGNLKKRLGMDLDSQNPESSQPQPAKGNSIDGESLMPVSTPYKRKQDEDDATPPKRLKLSSHADSGSPLFSPLTNGRVSVENSVDLIETLFIMEEERFCCTYKHPLTGKVCKAFVNGPHRRNRHRHLTYHAQSEELMLSVGEINAKDALLLKLLPKVVMSCDVGGCGYMETVWRTAKARVNHEKEYHPEVYLNRLRAKQQVKDRKFW